MTVSDDQRRGLPHSRYENTWAALRNYEDKVMPVLEREFDEALTQEAWSAAEAKYVAATKAVQDAFLEDTKDLNRESHVRHLSISEIRRIVEGPKDPPRCQKV